MERFKKYKSVIIVTIVVILIILVYILKQVTGIVFEDCSDPNCTNHHHGEMLYKVYNFSSNYCPACEEMKPIYAKIKDEFKDHVKFEYVDVNVNPSLANQYKIKYTPTFIIVDKEGNIVDQKVGYEEEEGFRAFVGKWVTK